MLVNRRLAQLEEEGSGKNEMVGCAKVRYEMSLGNGDNMSLTNLESQCLHHVYIYASLQEHLLHQHCVLIQLMHLSDVHLRTYLKVHLCGIENERVWFLRSATMTTKYPLQQHNALYTQCK